VPLEAFMQHRSPVQTRGSILAAANFMVFAGVLGASLVLVSAAVLPYGLAAAAGAMLYVVVEELIPETVRSGTPDVATVGFLGGFTIMMALDNALG
jgi:ZIP family zinc transporter